MGFIEGSGGVFYGNKPGEEEGEYKLPLDKLKQQIIVSNKDGEVVETIDLAEQISKSIPLH